MISRIDECVLTLFIGPNNMPIWNWRKSPFGCRLSNANTATIVGRCVRSLAPHNRNAQCYCVNAGRKSHAGVSVGSGDALNITILRCIVIGD